eukprot:8633726-Lingulodinium_polyedra.AAC.1
MGVIGVRLLTPAWATGGSRPAPVRSSGRPLVEDGVQQVRRLNCHRPSQVLASAGPAREKGEGRLGDPRLARGHPPDGGDRLEEGPHPDVVHHEVVVCMNLPRQLRCRLSGHGQDASSDRVPEMSPACHGVPPAREGGLGRQERLQGGHHHVMVHAAVDQ